MKDFLLFLLNQIIAFLFSSHVLFCDPLFLIQKLLFLFFLWTSVIIFLIVRRDRTLWFGEMSSFLCVLVFLIHPARNLANPSASWKTGGMECRMSFPVGWQQLWAFRSKSEGKEDVLNSAWITCQTHNSFLKTGLTWASPCCTLNHELLPSVLPRLVHICKIFATGPQKISKEIESKAFETFFLKNHN